MYEQNSKASFCDKALSQREITRHLYELHEHVHYIVPAHQGSLDRSCVASSIARATATFYSLVKTRRECRSAEAGQCIQ